MARRSSKGTKLQLHDDGDPGSFATVAHLHNLTPGEIGPDWQEATGFDSPGFVEEFIATVIRTGEIRGDLHWDPKSPTHDQHDGILAVAIAGELRRWRLVWLADTPDEFWMEFDALCRVQMGSASPTSILAGSITLRPSGEIEFPEA